MSLTAPTVTGYSKFWSEFDPAHAAYSMALAQARSKQAKHISKFMRRMGTRDAIGALAALIGAAAGGTATNTWSRIKHPGADEAVPQVTGFSEFGGNVVIETVTAINRATTAADITELKKWFNTTLLEAGITYPTVTGPQIQNGLLVNGVVRF